VVFEAAECGSGVVISKKLGCDRTWQIWLSDPDGNQSEVHQYTEKSAQLTTGGSVEVDWLELTSNTWCHCHPRPGFLLVFVNTWIHTLIVCFF
jgi:hypothetical protein